MRITEIMGIDETTDGEAVALKARDRALISNCHDLNAGQV
jgi:hypothetical protein